MGLRSARLQSLGLLRRTKLDKHAAAARFPIGSCIPGDVAVRFN